MSIENVEINVNGRVYPVNPGNINKEWFRYLNLGQLFHIHQKGTNASILLRTRMIGYSGEMNNRTVCLYLEPLHEGEEEWEHEIYV